MIYETKDYDTKDGIRQYLSRGLIGLHELIRHRHESGYERGERLHDFILLGRFFVDTCGNFCSCEFRNDAGERQLWMNEGLPEVIDREALFSILRALTIESRTLLLPNPLSRCEVCGEYWSLDNIHDSVSLPDASSRHVLGFLHRRCDEVLGYKQQHAFFSEVAEKVGLSVPPHLIPNEYCSEGRSWCLFRTTKGDLKVGRRKRVYNIDWSDMVRRKVESLLADPDRYDKQLTLRHDCSATILFEKEEVTKGNDYIHAYGVEKLVEYISKVLVTFGIGIQSAASPT